MKRRQDCNIETGGLDCLQLAIKKTPRKKGCDLTKEEFSILLGIPDEA